MPASSLFQGGQLRRRRSEKTPGPTTLEEAREECEEKGHKYYALAQTQDKVITACAHCDYYKVGKTVTKGK